MQQEIINYPFDELEDDGRSDSFSENVENVFIERPGNSDATITYVNGHHIPDEDEVVDDEDDLILGDEDELDEEDFDVDEIDVEVDDEDDEDITEDDLVLDVDDDDEDDEDL